MKRYALILILALLAAPTVADLIINFTAVPIGLADAIELSITPAGGGDLMAILTYEIKKDTGEVWKSSSHSVILTPPQETAVLQFLNDFMIPAANTAEGLTP